MKVLLINLASSIDRLDFQKKQLTRLGLGFERIDAVSKHSLGKMESTALSSGWERPLRTAEIACFLSHKKAWESIQRRDKPALVIEDDALISAHCKEVMLSVEKLKYCDLITLEVRSRKKTIAQHGTNILPEHKLYKLYQDRTGAAGYILWPSGARKLLQKAEQKAPALADAFISSCYTLAAYQVEPAAIIQLDQCKSYGIQSDQITHSTISSDDKPPAEGFSSIQPLIYKTRRILSQLRMGLRQLTVLTSSDKRPIRLNKAHFDPHHSKK